MCINTETLVNLFQIVRAAPIGGYKDNKAELQIMNINGIGMN